MSIRTNYSGNAEQQRLQRKIDRAYEMAGLARQDRDTADEQRWMKEVSRLRQELKDAR